MLPDNGGCCLRFFESYFLFTGNCASSSVEYIKRGRHTANSSRMFVENRAGRKLVVRTSWD